MARKCVSTHFSGANATCPVCLSMFEKTRPWQAFCSDVCRKAYWRMTKRTGAYVDIRKVLASIQADLAAIKSHLGLKGD